MLLPRILNGHIALVGGAVAPAGVREYVRNKEYKGKTEQIDTISLRLEPRGSASIEVQIEVFEKVDGKDVERAVVSDLRELRPEQEACILCQYRTGVKDGKSWTSFEPLAVLDPEDAVEALGQYLGLGKSLVPGLKPVPSLAKSAA